MNKYGLFGKLKAKPGKGDELANILLEASKLVSGAKGCHAYIVTRDVKDNESVCVMEAWDSKDDHDNSLKIPGCMELISQARPLLDGPPAGQELEVLGGKGAG